MSDRHVWTETRVDPEVAQVFELAWKQLTPLTGNHQALSSAVDRRVVRPPGKSWLPWLFLLRGNDGRPAPGAELGEAVAWMLRDTGKAQATFLLNQGFSLVAKSANVCHTSEHGRSETGSHLQPPER